MNSKDYFRSDINYIKNAFEIEKALDDIFNEFEKRMQTEFSVGQRKKVVPAAVIWPVAALLALVVGISCFLAGPKVLGPSNSGNTAANDQQHGGSNATGTEDSAIYAEDMYTANCQFTVDGLVGSVVLTQTPVAGETIEISGSSGKDAYGVVSMWNEGGQ